MTIRVSNCLFWAYPVYKLRVWRWHRAGRRPGFEPALVARPSRSDPSWIDHFLIGSDYEITQMQHGEVPGLPHLASFKPVSPKDAPWWMAWTHLLFRGRVRSGDFPDTKPLDVW